MRKESKKVIVQHFDGRMLFAAAVLLVHGRKCQWTAGMQSTGADTVFHTPTRGKEGVLSVWEKGVWGADREKDQQRQTDRQTDRERDQQRETDRQTERDQQRETDRPTDRQTDSQGDQQRDTDQMS